MIQEIASGIHTVDHRVVEGKNVVIFGNRHAAAVDVGTESEEGQAMADLIRAHGYEPNLVILTHGHNDHVLGGAAFAHSVVVANKRTPATIERHVRQTARRKNLDPAILLKQTLQPTVLFSGELVIDLGGRQLRLFEAPGHSEDSIAIHIEDERLLIASDSVATCMVPAISDGDSRELIVTLKRLKELDIDILVPGHGHVLRSKTEIEARLQWIINYLNEIRDFVRSLLADDPDRPDETVLEHASFERFVDGTHRVDQYQMDKRHRNVVTKILEEERS